MKNSHVCTFHKCGSNWFRGIMLAVTEQAGLNYKPITDEPGLLNIPVERNSDFNIFIYPGAKLKVFKPNYKDHEPLALCVRDPRDALVSQYWSWKYSHRNNSQFKIDMRKRLQDLSVQEGLLVFMHEDCFIFARQLTKWIEKRDKLPTYKLFRYENLLSDFKAEAESLFKHLGIGMGKVNLDKIQKKTSFTSRTLRKPGTEKKTSHLRKGIAGDYKNHFNDEITKIFNTKYNHMMTFLGYE